jgi:fatty-acyl-CoA synthase
MLEEKVTFSQGVPTVWLMLLEYLDKNLHIDPKELALERISSGGSALPRAMLERFEQQFGIDVQQGWGMTETSPIGVINTLLPKHIGIPEEERVALKLKQGRGVWGVEMKIVDDDGIEQPWDGSSRGNLLIRGPWIAGGYFKHEGGDALDKDGFFATGDVATINSDGFLQLVDRAKDVIKSGGEWISSIDLENATNSHPSISESAIIGIPHPKWQERPLLLVVKKEGKEVTKEELLKYLEDHVAKWWLPDDVIFLSELPHTATGKVMKHKLREEYKDFKLAS